MPTHRKRSCVPKLSATACPDMHWTPDGVKPSIGFWRVSVWNRKQIDSNNNNEEKPFDFFILLKRVL